MSEQLRYIVENLNKKPFEKSYTIISFDSLEQLALLQVLNDVLSELSQEQKVDLREEPPEQTAIRMLNTVKILGYKPRPEAKDDFRQGLVQGDKVVVYPLLQWLLQHLPELKKRAYLSRYLVMIDVPLEHLQDDSVADTHQTYQDMVEHFKDLHKAVEMERSSEYNTAEVRRDIEAMEEERKQLERQLDRLRRRIQTFPNHEDMLADAQQLRKERAKGRELEGQRRQQKDQLLALQQKAHRLQKDLDNVQNATIGLTADKVVAQLEDENNVQKMLARDDLPRKIETKRTECLELEKVLSESVVSEDDLDAIQLQIDDVSREIQELLEKRAQEEGSGSENLALFRQQASVIAHKRQKASEGLSSVMEELAEVERDLAVKRKELDDLGGIELIREEEFKKYIARLRSLSNTYKIKKAELSVLKAEFGVLSRTEEILHSRDDKPEELEKYIEKRKEKDGQESQISLEKVADARSDQSLSREKTIEELSRRVDQQRRAIEDKKAVLAPLVRDVRPLRKEHQQIKGVHGEHKLAYDNLSAGLQSNRAQLEKDVRTLWDECSSEESRYHYLNCMLESVHHYMERVVAEKTYMVSKDPAVRKKCLRDQLTRKILDQENLGKALRDKQKDVKETHGHAMKQVKMWHDLELLFQVKHECFERQQQQKRQAEAIEELASEQGRLVIT